MKIEIDVPDVVILKILKDTAETLIWHINYDIQSLKKYENDNKPLNKLKDLQDNYKLLTHINEIIKYYGGTAVEIISCEAKMGYDIHGKKYQHEN